MMVLIQFFLILIILASIMPTVYSQSDDNISNKKKMKMKAKGSRGKAKARGGRNKKEFPKALQINYPLSHFHLDNTRNWKDPAVYDEKFVNIHKTSKGWVQQSRAQDQEDIWLWERYFYGMTHGVVMESGALDGDLFSNSHLFEKFANWTTINVEADPNNYGNLILNRPNAVNVNGALCSEPRSLHYSSYGVIPVRGFIEFMTESFIKQWHGPIYNKKVAIEDLPTVQCLPVKTLLKHLGVNHIDLWILDVEGAEESVLKGVDFDAVNINMIAMECDDHDVSKNSRKTKIIEDNNYKCELVSRNCMCTKNNFKPSELKGEKTRLKFWNGNKWVWQKDPPLWRGNKVDIIYMLKNRSCFNN